MATSAPRSGRRRPWPSVVARTALVVLLLPQLAILWVLHRPSPTGLPAALVAAVADGLLGEATAELRRATVDKRGVVSLEGLRVAHAPSGLAFAGDARVAFPWHEWLAGRPATPLLMARGELLDLAGDGRAMARDLVVRAGDPEGAWLHASARLGDVTIRAEAVAAAPLGDRLARRGPSGLAANWRAALRELSRLEGGAEIRLAHGGWTAEAALRGRPGAAGGWKLGSLEAWVTDDAGDLVGWARADGVGLGDLEAGRLSGHILGPWATVTLKDGRWGALAGVDGTAGMATGRQGGIARVGLSAGDSRANLRFSDPRGAEGWRLDGLSANLRSAELLRLPGVADALRRAEIDLAGGVEVADATVEIADGALAKASGWVAIGKAGWKDIRASIIRPDRPEAALSGHVSVDLGERRFVATKLDLAGLAGSIEGGLSAGDAYVVRLASTPDNPVHPRCLDSLLGDWWVDLWKRFDLTTAGAFPHADVVVRGKWGASHADHVLVGASLGRFGFMGARFGGTDVRVEATPRSTVVHIDRLLGELEGKPAGAATGTVTWDWTSGVPFPDIRAEGDLHPLVALRMHPQGDEHAARLRGSNFGESHLRVHIPPKGPTTVELRTKGESEILGARLGELDLRLGVEGDSPMTLTGSGLLAGGKVTLDLSGDLGGRSEVRAFRAEGIRWALLPRSLPFLFEEPAKDGDSEAVLGADFKGIIDLGAKPSVEGEGSFTLIDPQLRRVRLFGVLSQGLDTLGLGFSGYDLTRATGEFRVKDNQASLPRLVIGGEEAELRLAGVVDLNSGVLNLSGNFELRDSPWGPLGFLNPNRLITKVIRIRVEGTLANPETKVRSGF